MHYHSFLDYLRPIMSPVHGASHWGYSNDNERRVSCFQEFTVSWGLLSCCNEISAMGRHQAWRASRVQSHLFRRHSLLRVRSLNQGSPRAFSLVGKLAKQCHRCQHPRERQKWENEGRQRRWMAGWLALCSRKEPAFSPGYF